MTKSKQLTILPRLPLADDPVRKASAEVVSIYSNRGYLGDVGFIWTSIVGLEVFLWYQMEQRPKGHELTEMREELEDWLVKRGLRVWMVAEKADKRLQRWAKFMGFVNAGPYDARNDLYKRREWA